MTWWVPLSFAFALGGGAACTPREGVALGQAQDPDCPLPGLRLVPGSPGVVTLGSRACTNFPNVLPAGPYEVAPFCMQVLPFPAQEGLVFAPGNESPEGQRLSWLEVAALDLRLASRYGLRVCNVAELLWASAGPGNEAFVYRGPRRPGVCAEDADGARNDGYRLPMGSEKECVSWAGIHDLGTRNTWARLDVQARAAMDTALAVANGPGACELRGDPPLSRLDPALRHVVLGASLGEGEDVGTMSGDGFGLHWHGAPWAFYDAPPAEPLQWADDQLRLCSDPGPPDPARAAAWRQATSKFLETLDYGIL